MKKIKETKCMKNLSALILSSICSLVLFMAVAFLGFHANNAMEMDHFELLEECFSISINLPPYTMYQIDYITWQSYPGVHHTMNLDDYKYLYGNPPTTAKIWSMVSYRSPGAKI